jgi:hypothetical protein
MPKKSAAQGRRPFRLPDWAPLDDAPENELGVVFLFSSLARKKFGLRVAQVKAGFPDCIAFQGTKRIRIEFEFKSKNFRTHAHKHKHCDWIVCWEHNWPGMPKNLVVKELRREFGLGFNVWFQPVSVRDENNYADSLAEPSSAYWSVPSLAIEGDLLLYYRTAKCDGLKSCVQDIFRVASSVKHGKAGWKPGKDYYADIRRVCKLNAPVHFKDFLDNAILRNASFVRGQMQGRPRASDYWPELYRMIVSRNRSLEPVLRKYGPQRLT